MSVINKLKELNPEQLAKLKKSLVKKEKSISGPVKLSFFFFSDNGSIEQGQLYELLLDCAKFADHHGFHSVWVPERHFHEFGGPYPNPSVLLSAVAMVTKNIQLRSGSVVLPLHHPMRVAEEWSMLDNLSQGRVGLSIASGWNKDDFILSNANYDQRKEIMFSHAEQIKQLWRGQPVVFKDSSNRSAAVSLYPKPVSKKLPIWVTSAGNPETWISAGKIGANILTGLMEQTVEELGAKIALYKKTLKENGYNPEAKEISVMLHTHIGANLEQVKETVRPALTSYLKTHMSVYEKQLNNARATDIDLSLISDEDKEALIAKGFERYFTSSGLLGTVDTSYKMVKKLEAIGVTEICGLINFGLEDQVILDGLSHFNRLREKVSEEALEPA